jgi:hypothetical protein
MEHIAPPHKPPTTAAISHKAKVNAQPPNLKHPFGEFTTIL